jgi:hypothetical protein
MILGCLVGGVNAAHHRRGFFRDDQDPLGKIGPDVTSSGAGFQHNLGDQRGPDQSGAIVRSITVSLLDALLPGQIGKCLPGEDHKQFRVSATENRRTEQEMLTRRSRNKTNSPIYKDSFIIIQTC